MSKKETITVQKTEVALLFNNIKKNESGGYGYVLTSKQWIEKTKAIGIIAKPGRT
jgi:hypothetical protein